FTRRTALAAETLAAPLAEAEDLGLISYGEVKEGLHAGQGVIPTRFGRDHLNDLMAIFINE
ncbi:MAG: hypothetical protein HQL49_10355, partial [Gammaproteobacteria bacterium]|nr:hypothetical protein [Gammaproteobacteria bacterium]